MSMSSPDGLFALDLACGQTPTPGYVGVDLWPGADVQCDLSQYPWPWGTSSVDRVVCSHYVEHVTDLIGFMNELWRIMKPGGDVLIVHPYERSNRAWRDPTHVRALNEESWLYYNARQRSEWGLDHYPIIANFDIVNVTMVLAPGIVNPTQSQLRNGWNVIDDLRVELRAVKQ